MPAERRPVRLPCGAGLLRESSSVLGAPSKQHWLECAPERGASDAEI